MNDQTLVAVYDTTAHADAAVRDLKLAGVPAASISQHAKKSTVSSKQEPGFWSNLFGTEPDYDTDVYDRSIDSGSTVVTVSAPEANVDRLSAILEKHNPVDLEERAAKSGSGSIQLAEESLAVGKRKVGGGTTRVRRFVVTTPVEERVNLRSEKVTVDRRPVNDGRPVTDRDFADKSIEMRETSEEAVVSKTARVKEEVSLHKNVSDRVETIKDSVRHDEVKIEKVSGKPTDIGRATAPAASKAANPAQRGKF